MHNFLAFHLLCPGRLHIFDVVCLIQNNNLIFQVDFHRLPNSWIDQIIVRTKYYLS